MYGGTFGTFWYGVYLMVTDGFWFGLSVSTLGAGFIFMMGLFSAAAGKVMVES
jgi:hypothetical protein